MSNIITIKNILTKHKQRLFTAYGLRKMAIFGSYARNEQTENSDVDILVEFEKPIGIAFIDLAEELEQLLRKKVDLVSAKGVKPNHFRLIEKELSYV